MWFESGGDYPAMQAKGIRVDTRNAVSPTAGQNNRESFAYAQNSEHSDSTIENRNAITEAQNALPLKINSLNQSFHEVAVSLRNGWPDLLRRVNETSRLVQQALQLASSSWNQEYIRILTQQNLQFAEMGMQGTLPQVLDQLLRLASNSTQVINERVAIANSHFEFGSVRFEANGSNSLSSNTNRNANGDNLSGTHNGMIGERYSIVDTKTNRVLGIIAPPNGEIVFTPESFERAVRSVKESTQGNKVSNSAEDQAAIRAGDVPPSKLNDLKNLQEQNYQRFGAMSKEQFLSLFGNAGLPQQVDLGNCYLISSVNSLRNNLQFEYLMRMSIKFYPEGCSVKIPLGDPNGREIYVGRNELAAQIPNLNYGKPKMSGGKIIQPMEMDTRQYITPINGPLGYKMLVAAASKLINESRGNGLVADYAKTEGGWSEEALNLLLDGQAQDPNRPQKTYEGKTRSINSRAEISPNGPNPDLYSMLDNFRPGVDCFTMDSRYLGKAWGHDVFYKIDGSDQKIAQSHSYAIVGVDKSNREVIIENPWNTGDGKERIVLRYDQVAASFSRIYNNKLNLRNIYTV